MIITKETDYAIRILRGLAHGERMATTELTLEQKIPLQFAYKIIKKLENAGIISILRGKHGGCLLVRDLREINLYELMLAMEENRYISHCMQLEYSCPWRGEHEFCTVHTQLEKLQVEIYACLRATSLHQLILGEKPLPESAEQPVL